MPTDHEIERCLRSTTRDAKKRDEVTINAVRQQVEEKLALADDFLRGSAWKTRSKEIIEAVFNDDGHPSPDSVQKVVKKPASKQTNTAKAGEKRESENVGPANKRRRTATVEESEDVDISDNEASSGKNGSIGSSEDAEENEHEHEQPDTDGDEAQSRNSPQPLSRSKVEADDNDDSDMSIVHDDPLPSQKRQKKSSSTTKAKPSAKTSSKSSKEKSSSGKALSSDEEEIKRLQGWLIKCGMRKMWSRELAPYSTSKEKIKHLKKMLEGVGMSGRYSAEKARQIKEARELEAEIQSAQEFNQAFGHKGDDSDEDEDADGHSGRKPIARPRKALPKGLVDFGDSGDDESS